MLDQVENSGRYQIDKKDNTLFFNVLEAAREVFKLAIDKKNVSTSLVLVKDKYLMATSGTALIRFEHKMAIQNGWYSIVKTDSNTIMLLQSDFDCRLDKVYDEFSTNEDIDGIKIGIGKSINTNLLTSRCQLEYNKSSDDKKFMFDAGLFAPLKKIKSNGIECELALSSKNGKPLQLDFDNDIIFLVMPIRIR